MKSPLLPVYKWMALTVKKITNWSLERCFRWSVRHYDKYIDYVNMQYLKGVYISKSYRTKDLAEEFRFRGFVDLREFKKKPICNYVQSNRSVGGITYIYPKHYANTWDAMSRGYTHIWDEFPFLGIAGYTRIDVRYQ